MTKKEKFLFIFLQIITFGLIWIYWNQKKKEYQQENTLSTIKKTNINLINLIQNLGGPNNIVEIENTHTKIKITYKERSLIKVEEIQHLKGISGVFINNQFISIIVGNNAEFVKNEIKKLI